MSKALIILKSIVHKIVDFPFYSLIIALLCLQIVVLSLYIDYPLLDRHAFRQTQTALSAYWLMMDFDPLHYITPVLGAPWAVPFEFPLYQMMAAFLAKSLPFLGLDAALRVVSWCFSIAVVYPLYRITTRYAHDKVIGLTAVCFYLACPFYMFWGRTAMIESTALFFTLMCFWQLIRLGDTPSWYFAALAAVFGVCAALVKVTTIPAYMAAGYVHILVVQKNKISSDKYKISPKNIFIFLLPGIISLLTAYVWYSYADQVKALNEYGAYLTSKNLQNWNYGSLQQRLSEETWRKFWYRIRHDIFPRESSAALLCGIVIFFRYTSAKNKFFALASILLFTLPLLIFTSLHYVHDYYQISCAVALIAAAAFLIHPGEHTKLFKLHIIIVLCISIFLSCGFFKFRKDIISTSSQNTENETLIAAEIIKKNTNENSAILVYGWDWSSEVIYYSQRKGITMPQWSTGEISTEMFVDKVTQMMGGLPLGALVVRNSTGLPQHHKNEIAAFLAITPVRFTQQYKNVKVYILQ